MITQPLEYVYSTNDGSFCLFLCLCQKKQYNHLYAISSYMFNFQNPNKKSNKKKSAGVGPLSHFFLNVNDSVCADAIS